MSKLRTPCANVSILVLKLVLIILACQINRVDLVKLRACLPFSTSGTKNNACVCNDGDKPEVRCIRVSGLTEIPSTFLPKVQMLTIQYGDVQWVYADDFAGYDYITDLSLLDLQIHVIDEKAFRNLYRLRYLSLVGNALTRLDPSGKMFQFLTSLELLDVSQNKITTINQNSFLTITPVNPPRKLKVVLRANQINCGCDVIALRKWMAKLEYQTLEFEDFACNVDGQTVGYDRFSLAKFPQCVATVNETTHCSTCSSTSTNYECNNWTVVGCNSGERCRKSVIYEYGKFNVTSFCDNKDTCAEMSYENRNKCLESNVTEGSLHCSYCCTDLICGTDSKTDRTSDFLYKMHYFTQRSSISEAMFSSKTTEYRLEMAELQNRLTKTVSPGWQGGIFYDVERIEPAGAGLIKISLKVAVTVFNWKPEKEVFEDLARRMNFFYEEYPDISSVSAVFSRINSVMCPEQRNRVQGYTMNWPSIFGGDDARVLCTNLNDFNPDEYALRRCVKVSSKESVWAPIDSTRCYSPTTSTTTTTTTTTTPQTIRTRRTTTTPTTTTTKRTTSTTTLPPITLPSLTTSSYTPQEAQDTSDEILRYIESADQLTSNDVNQVVDLLEKLSETSSNLAYGTVSESMLSCVDGVIGASLDTLKTSEQQKHTSVRLLDVIDKVGESAPTTNGKFEFESPTLGVAAIEIPTFTTSNVVFQEASSTDDQLGVNVGFNRRTPTPKAGYSNIVLPTDSIRKKLPPSQRQALKKMTFSLLNDSKLFDTLETGKGQNSVSVNDAADKNDDDDRNRLYVRQVNGKVLSASVPGVTIEDLSDNITMTFDHTEGNATSPECVYWDPDLKEGRGAWSSRGCGVVRTDEESTTCGCNHLTNFALLMDVYQEGSGLSDSDRLALSIISFIGCGVSLFTLILTLLTYSLFRKLRRDTPSKILINLCIAMAMSNVIFLAGMQDYTFDSEIACKVVAVLLHYFLLASLTWMAVEAFYMYLALVLVFKTYFSNFILKISLFGWGVPLIAIAATLGVNATDNYGLLGTGMCWIKTPAFYYAFVAPVGLILLVNFIAFGLVIRQLMQMSSAKLNTSDRYGTMQRLRGAVGVIILLGLTWVFAVFAIDSASIVFYYLFAIFNSLQGLFIFIFYCVFKADAAASWRRFLSCCFDQTDLASTSASRGRTGHSNNSSDKTEKPLLTTSSNRHGTRRKGSSSSGNNTMSTASTVVKGSSSNGNNSHIYDSIDSSSYSQTDYNYMNLSQSSQNTPASSNTSSWGPKRQGSNSMVTKFTSDVDTKKFDHGLNHVYSNQPNKHQMDRDSGSSSNSPPRYQYDRDTGSPTGPREQPYVQNINTISGNQNIPQYARVNSNSSNTHDRISRHPSQDSQYSSSSIRHSPGSPVGAGYVSSVVTGAANPSASSPTGSLYDSTPSSVKDIRLRFENSSSSSIGNTRI